jgi:hypothetical protein
MNPTIDLNIKQYLAANGELVFPLENSAIHSRDPAQILVHARY